MGTSLTFDDFRAAVSFRPQHNMLTEDPLVLSLQPPSSRPHPPALINWDLFSFLCRRILRIRDAPLPARARAQLKVPQALVIGFALQYTVQYGITFDAIHATYCVVHTTYDILYSVH